jgi:hypothetical protein
VVHDYLSPGESVKDKPILRLAEIDPLRVEVFVPVASFGAIAPGQTATIRPEAPGEGDFTATVSIVDRVADAASGTFRVRLTLPNKDYRLPSGLKCRVAFSAAPPEPGLKVAAASGTLPQPATAPAPATASAPAPAPSTPTAAAPVPFLAKSPGGLTRIDRRTADYRRATRVARAISRPAPAPVVEARREVASLPKCHTIGPVVSSARADQLRDVFVDRVDRVLVRTSPTDKPSDYLVLSPPQPSAEETQLLAARMREAGIRDLHVYRRGAHANRIALGIYAGSATAETRRASLAALGFAAEVMPRTAGGEQFWVDMESADTADAVGALNRTLASVAPDLNLFPVACNRLFVARQ